MLGAVSPTWRFQNPKGAITGYPIFDSHRNPAETQNRPAMYGIYYFQVYHSIWLDFYLVDSFCKIFPKKCHLMNLGHLSVSMC